MVLISSTTVTPSAAVKIAISAAFQRKFNFFIRKNTAKKYLRGVIGMFFYSGALQFAVDACALIGAVKAGKAVVNAASPAQEFHQLAHRQRDLYWGIQVPARARPPVRGSQLRL